MPLLPLTFLFFSCIAIQQGGRPSLGAGRTVGSDTTILDHEIVFWFGDLNYRIEESQDKNNGSSSSYNGSIDSNYLDVNRIHDLIERKDFSLLKKRDQLNIEREKGNVFQNFEEGDLTFAPTYKYQPNTNQYERRAEKKIRAPAWCDRVLYRTMNKKFLQVKQINYFRSELLPSDHKPVGSFFECKLRVIITEQENFVYQELMKKLEFWTKNTNTVNVMEAMSSEPQPLPTVSITGLKMKNLMVKYDVPCSSKIMISNDGGGIVHWRFVPKLDDPKICKKWITVSARMFVRTSVSSCLREHHLTSYTVLCSGMSADNHHTATFPASCPCPYPCPRPYPYPCPRPYPYPYPCPCPCKTLDDISHFIILNTWALFLVTLNEVEINISFACLCTPCRMLNSILNYKTNTSPCGRQVSQQRGLLLPGEVADVTMSVLVDRRTSQLLNIGL